MSNRAGVYTINHDIADNGILSSPLLPLKNCFSTRDCMVPRAKYRGVNTADSLPSQVVLETSFFTFDIL